MASKRDHKVAEGEWRATKQRATYPKTRNQLHLGTVLKWVVPALVIILILTY